MNERGAITVVVLAVVSILMLAGVGLVALGRLVAAHVQVTTAADAAALAAAPLTYLGGDPSAEAARFAAENGARLTSCSCPPNPTQAVRVVLVEVEQELDLPVFGGVVVRGRAAAEFAPADLMVDRR